MKKLIIGMLILGTCIGVGTLFMLLYNFIVILQSLYA
jgi:hypothetical protein